MTLDQKIQVWSAVGSWVSGLGALAAVCLSLWLVNRTERVRIRASAGIRLLFEGDGTPAERHVCISVTNIGDRPVTVNTVGWRIGGWRKRRFCIQTVGGKYSNQFPIELAHGKSASFMVSLAEAPTWPSDFVRDFVHANTPSELRNLRAMVNTSVGQSILVVPESNLIEELAVAPMERSKAPA